MIQNLDYKRNVLLYCMYDTVPYCTCTYMRYYPLLPNSYTGMHGLSINNKHGYGYGTYTVRYGTHQYVSRR
jgi:hypothetical protein